ncbi:VIT1/CCC1 transporter family protein [Candidatus Kaiserbacteria bacterium]|nr:VIT1/CCC1 transporter family protein [Candidatus Kaiserbacteria bacterium]
MQTSALYLRTIIFGITDSLVSTVGLLAGIDVAGAPHATLALTGIVYAFVEAFSMAVGNFLSEESAEEYTAKGAVNPRSALAGGMAMFVVFVLAAFIPILPYLLFSTWVALAGSIGFSIFALFVVGLVSGRLAELPMLARGVRMVVLGGAAVIIGAIVGSIIPAI